MSQYTKLLEQYKPILDNPFTKVEEINRIRALLSLANTTEKS